MKPKIMTLMMMTDLILSKTMIDIMSMRAL